MLAERSQPDILTSLAAGQVETTARRVDSFRLGLQSLIGVFLAPLGSLAARFHRSPSSSSTARLEHGLIIILPGIEGCSTINDSIARGLVVSQLPHAIQIIDWRRFRPWNPLQMAMQQHNRTQARALAELITEYQRNFPGRAVHLIGHSAGAGMALFILEELQDSQTVTTVTLMAAAISRTFDVVRLLGRTKFGIWSYYSPLDLPTVGLGTVLFGTMDRHHGFSAGALGFKTTEPSRLSDSGDHESGARLRQIRYHRGMAKSWNFGGHFGPTNAVFVQENVAPVCRLQ